MICPNNTNPTNEGFIEDPNGHCTKSHNESHSNAGPQHGEFQILTSNGGEEKAVVLALLRSTVSDYPYHVALLHNLTKHHFVHSTRI